VKRNYNELLIWSAALVTVVRYAAAFIASDMGEITGWLSDLVTVALGFSGIGMGVLDVIGGAALFQGWRHIMPKSGQPWPFRFKVLTVFVFGLIFNGIVIIVPFTVSRVLGETMKAALGGGFWVWVWSAAVNIAPYMLIGGVSVSSNLVATGNEQPANQPRKVTGKLPENITVTSEDWRKVSRNEYAFIASASTEAICSRFGVSDRTARNWRKNAQEKMV